MRKDKEFREGLEGFPGHLAAGRLLAKHPTHFAAWSELEIFPRDAAEEYLTDLAIVAARRTEEANRVDGTIQIAIQFALVAVLADRERRAEDEEHEHRVRERQAQSEPEDDNPADEKDIPF